MASNTDFVRSGWGTPFMFTGTGDITTLSSQAFAADPVRALADMDLGLDRAELKKIQQMRAANLRVAPGVQGYQIVEETLTAKKPRAKRKRRAKAKTARKVQASDQIEADVEPDEELKARLEALKAELENTENQD